MGSGPQPYSLVYDTDNGLQYSFETGLVPLPTLPFTGDIVQASTFPASAGAHSYQGMAADVTLEAASGSSSGSNPKFLAGGMFSIHGSSLTSTANYLGGVIGQYDIPGTKATTYPAGAVLGMIADATTAADGAFVAFVDGDGDVTTANAAFKAMSNNSTAGSGFSYGLDLYAPAHDGYNALAILNADIRMTNQVCILNGAGVPSTAGTGFASKGSIYVDTTNGKLYVNGGTSGTPSWKIVTSA